MGSILRNTTEFSDRQELQNHRLFKSCNSGLLHSAKRSEILWIQPMSEHCNPIWHAISYHQLNRFCTQWDQRSYKHAHAVYSGTSLQSPINEYAERPFIWAICNTRQRTHEGVKYQNSGPPFWQSKTRLSDCLASADSKDLKPFPWSTRMSMKFSLIFKITVAILIFIGRTNFMVKMLQYLIAGQMSCTTKLSRKSFIIYVPGHISCIAR